MSAFEMPDGVEAPSASAVGPLGDLHGPLRNQAVSASHVARVTPTPSPVLGGEVRASGQPGRDVASPSPQPRERPVSCRECGHRTTWNVDAVCCRCRP